MSTKETSISSPGPVCKISIRVEPGLRDDVKAVASLSGMRLEAWVKGLIRNELERMQPAIEALRSASAR